MRKRWYMLGGGCALLLIGLLVQATPPPSARQRLGILSYIPPDVPVTPASARTALFRQLPVGTAEATIYTYLQQHRVGTDGHSSYAPADADGVIACVLKDTFQPFHITFIDEDYSVRFSLDAAKRLRDITIEQWLTGP